MLSQPLQLSGKRPKLTDVQSVFRSGARDPVSAVRSVNALLEARFADEGW